MIFEILQKDSNSKQKEYHKKKPKRDKQEYKEIADNEIEEKEKKDI